MTPKRRVSKKKAAALKKVIKDALLEGRIGYQCVFCGKMILKEPRRGQQWFTHLACFNKATGERAHWQDR